MTDVRAEDDSKFVNNLLEAIELEANRLSVSVERLQELGVFDRQDFWRPEDWTELANAVDAENAKQALETKRDQFQRSIREKLVDRWLDQRTTIPKWNRQSVQITVEQYLRDDRKNELSQYLTDLMQIGLQKAEKKRERAERGGG